MKPDQEKLKNVLIESVVMMCQKGLNFKRELQLRGVIGVTVDHNDHFIIHIDQTLDAESSCMIDSSTSLLNIKPEQADPNRQFSNSSLQTPAKLESTQTFFNNEHSIKSEFNTSNNISANNNNNNNNNNNVLGRNTFNSSFFSQAQNLFNSNNNNNPNINNVNNTNSSSNNLQMALVPFAKNAPTQPQYMQPQQQLQQLPQNRFATGLQQQHPPQQHQPRNVRLKIIKRQQPSKSHHQQQQQQQATGQLLPNPQQQQQFQAQQNAFFHQQRVQTPRQFNMGIQNQQMHQQQLQSQQATNSRLTFVRQGMPLAAAGRGMLGLGKGRSQLRGGQQIRMSRMPPNNALKSESGMGRLKVGKSPGIPFSGQVSRPKSDKSFKLVSRYICDIDNCNASFSLKSNLRRHQKAKHEGGGGGAGDDDDDDDDDGGGY